jgi:type II secretory pathway component GspD/PulD (secretin)
MRLISVLIIFALAFLSSAQNVQDHFKIDHSKRISVSFRNASVDEVAFYFTQQTSIAVVANPKITQKISIFSHKPMSIQDAYTTFFIALKNINAEVTIQNKIIIIDYKRDQFDYKPWNYGFELKHYKLQYADSASVARNLNNLFLNSSRASYEPYSNTLLIYAPRSIQVEIKSILTKIDVPVYKQFDTKVFRLKYAYASVLSPIVSNIISVMDKSNSITTYDLRTNSLIVSAAPESLTYISVIIEKLDVNVLYEDATFFVKLKAAKSEDLIIVIRSLFR